jgi:hypothetical protein
MTEHANVYSASLLRIRCPEQLCFGSERSRSLGLYLLVDVSPELL